ncbi:DNA-binding transcriptional regulator, PadR family [Paenibacillus sp. 1_12]|uniref:PadR family transcriptional regulator n=1 Tax=Paenibacillus sp. 1_12 TaxID=1566278 RepID=UPI0008E5657E|nr:PadR family transcriptional regulator [Paenibacillus sp. 1_12]SFL11391.1 DNA-binding transcriptional regulator, PadR family [Paenibacillus sp. 1_12]
MTGQDVILGILAVEPKSGYDIKKKFEDLFSYFFDASFGTIYPTLAKLEKEGFITKESVLQEGKPNKHVYSITEPGRVKFQSYLQSDIQDNVLRSDFMVRLIFGELADPQMVTGWMNDALQRSQAELHNLENDYKRFSSGMSPTQEICIQIGIGNLRSQVQVLQQGIARLHMMDSMEGKSHE